MGMSGSQARLMSLTGKLHNVELKAQNLMANKIALATQKDELYQDYCDALDATRIKVAYRDDAMNLDYKDANYSTLCSYNEYRRKSYALRDNKTGLMIVSQKVYDAYEGFGNDKYAFAYALMGYDYEFGWQHGANASFRTMGTDIGIGKSQEKYEAAGFKYANDDTGSLYMTEAEAKAYEEYIGITNKTDITSNTTGHWETKINKPIEGYSNKLTGSINGNFRIVNSNGETIRQNNFNLNFNQGNYTFNTIKQATIENAQEQAKSHAKAHIAQKYPEDLSTDQTIDTKWQEPDTKDPNENDSDPKRHTTPDITTPQIIKCKNEIIIESINFDNLNFEETPIYGEETEESIWVKDEPATPKVSTTTNTTITDLQAKYEALIASESKDLDTQKEALKAFRDTLYAVCGEAIFNYMNINKNGAGNKDNELNSPDAEWGTFKNEFNYYLQLWDAINTAGGCQIVDPQFESGDEGNEWFNNMVNAGLVQILVWDDNGSGSNCWSETSPSTSYNENYLQELQDETEIKKAETKYEHDLGLINDKDKKYDLELSKLETTRSAITTEMDSIKKARDENIERTFGIFG